MKAAYAWIVVVPVLLLLVPAVAGIVLPRVPNNNANHYSARFLPMKEWSFGYHEMDAIADGPPGTRLTSTRVGHKLSLGYVEISKDN